MLHVAIVLAQYQGLKQKPNLPLNNSKLITMLKSSLFMKDEAVR